MCILFSGSTKRPSRTPVGAVAIMPGMQRAPEPEPEPERRPVSTQEEQVYNEAEDVSEEYQYNQAPPPIPTAFAQAQHQEAPVSSFTGLQVAWAPNRFKKKKRKLVLTDQFLSDLVRIACVL